MWFKQNMYSKKRVQKTHTIYRKTVVYREVSMWGEYVGRVWGEWPGEGMWRGNMVGYEGYEGYEGRECENVWS